MTQINPFTGAIIQSGQIPPRQLNEKERQIRRLQNLGKNAALQGDRLEHEVESADTLQPTGDSERQPRKKAPAPRDPGSLEEGEAPHIDLTA